MRVLIGILGILSLTACGNPVDVQAEASLLSQNEIAIQWAAWQTQRGLQGYTIEVYRSCNCVKPANYFYNYRLSVDSNNNNILIEAIDEDGNVLQALPDNPTYYPNIDEIFELMDDTLSGGHPVSGSFDSDESYPTTLELGLQETYEITLTGYF